MPAPEQEQLPAAFSRLIQDTPAVFFGLYRAEDGVPVVVFNPGVDPATWDDRLTAAATWIDYPAVGSGYRSNTCSRHWKSLRVLQDEIVRTSNDWAAPPRRAAFGVWVQPETCTVRVESDVLLPSEIRTLVDRYGTALSFDTSEGAAGSLLPLDSHPVRRRHAD